MFEIQLALLNGRNQADESSLRYQKYHLDINSKEDLMKLLIQRTSNYPLNKHNCKYFSVVYSLRSYLFLLLGSLYEYWFWQLKKVSVLVQTNYENEEKLRLFKHLDKLKDRIPDYELEWAKYQRLKGNKCKAKDYLMDNLNNIEKKFNSISKDKMWSKHILNINLVYDIRYFWFEVMLEIDPSSLEIKKKFIEYLISMSNPIPEKIFELNASYIDHLIFIDEGKGQIYLKNEDTSGLLEYWIRCYFESINKGNYLLWQTLPRILEIWFQLKKEEQNIKEIIEEKLLELDTYKIVQILPILLSRFSMPKYKKFIAKLISKVAVEYPAQSAWWLSHLKNFYASTDEDKIEDEEEMKRGWFDKLVYKEIKQLLIQRKDTNSIKNNENIEDEASPKNINDIFEATSKLMKALIEFGTDQCKIFRSAKLQSIQLQREIHISIDLLNFDFNSNYVIMPILSNLKPNLPKSSENLENFKWYNPNPVRITGILQTCVVLNSKDWPIRIGFTGSDHKDYYFLLKFDESGDLRKEARFMIYASLINTIFENDQEWKSRNLSLHTYSVVSLSRSTGLIEWMSNTKTIKNVIWTKWKELGVKVDLGRNSEVRRFVKDGKVSTAWNEIMKITKDVLWECLRERFPTAEAMFNCRTKFIYSYAAWCIIGYFIGLGDRHWDNIMLHTNTGEVSHVDFDCIFECGKKLSVAERVPFRLTRNVTDLFGVLREKCIFKKVCKVVWKAVKVNKQNVLRVLSLFLHDPIFKDEENAKEYLERIDNKISCNDVLLNNGQTEQISHNYEGFVRTSKNAENLSMIDEQISMLIHQAMDKDILKEMYFGWMPWM